MIGQKVKGSQLAYCSCPVQTVFSLKIIRGEFTTEFVYNHKSSAYV